MNSNKNIFGKILKWVCIVLIFLTCVLSTLIVSLGLINSCSSSNIAKADYTETAGIFHGSNLTTFGNYFDDGDEYTDVNPGQTAPTAITFDYYVLIVNENPYTNVFSWFPKLYVRAYSFLSTPIRPNDGAFGAYPPDIDSNGYVGLNLFNNRGNNVYNPWYGDYDLGYYNNPVYPGYCLNVVYETPLAFNCNVTTVRRYSIDNTSEGSNFFNCSNCIDLVDNLGNVFTIKFNVCWEKVKSVYERIAWEDSTYYLANNITENQIYQDGFDKGEVKGKLDGFSEGYDKGKSDGLSEGELKGYNEAWQEANENKFSFEWFLQNTLNILDVKIFGVFGLGDIFKVVLGVSLVIIVLKLFAGG